MSKPQIISVIYSSGDYSALYKSGYKRKITHSSYLKLIEKGIPVTIVSKPEIIRVTKKYDKGKIVYIAIMSDDVQKRITKQVYLVHTLSKPKKKVTWGKNKYHPIPMRKI